MQAMRAARVKLATSTDIEITAESNYPKEMNPLTDTDPMPFGLHRGKPMQDVPARYLLWLRDQGGCHHLAVNAYIFENLDALEKECPDRIKSDEVPRSFNKGKK